MSTAASPTGLRRAAARQASRLATALARRAARRRRSTDPMSGFFMMRRDALRAAGAAPLAAGLQDPARHPAATARGRCASRGALRLRARASTARASSTRGSRWNSSALLLEKLTGDVVPVRFVLFCLVGLTGVVDSHGDVAARWHAAVELRRGADDGDRGRHGLEFRAQQLLTYRDRRLTGWRSSPVCPLPGGLRGRRNRQRRHRELIYERDPRWWIAGLGGAVMGAVWNYVVSATFVWRQR